MGEEVDLRGLCRLPGEGGCFIGCSCVRGGCLEVAMGSEGAVFLAIVWPEVC